ncbi:MAG: EamA family transporter [Acidimicrobiia bacterium]|nr:EamA family transporter [Acidimicrobiia bacterium]
MSQILALASAAFYGFADFSGGLASRSTPTWAVVAWSQILGVPILVLGLVVVDAPDVNRSDLVYGAIAGIIGLLGIAALYQALARGSMSVVSPLTGALVALIPVIVGLAIGEILTTRQWFGIMLAVVAVVLVSSSGETTKLDGAVLGLAFVAAVWFAAFFVILDRTSIDAGLWPLVLARSVSIPVAFTIAFASGVGRVPARNAIGVIAVAGVFDMAANIAILLALQSGPLGTGSVLSSLYPAFTVLAAVVVISEMPSRLQWIGVALALLAAVLLSV